MSSKSDILQSVRATYQEKLRTETFGEQLRQARLRKPPPPPPKETSKAAESNTQISAASATLQTKVVAPNSTSAPSPALHSVSEMPLRLADKSQLSNTKFSNDLHISIHTKSPLIHTQLVTAAQSFEPYEETTKPVTTGVLKSPPPPPTSKPTSNSSNALKTSKEKSQLASASKLPMPTSYLQYVVPGRTPSSLKAAPTEKPVPKATLNQSESVDEALLVPARTSEPGVSAVTQEPQPLLPKQPPITSTVATSLISKRTSSNFSKIQPCHAMETKPETVSSSPFRLKDQAKASKAPPMPESYLQYIVPSRNNVATRSHAFSKSASAGKPATEKLPFPTSYLQYIVPSRLSALESTNYKSSKSNTTAVTSSVFSELVSEVSEEPVVRETSAEAKFHSEPIVQGSQTFIDLSKEEAIAETNEAAEVLFDEEAEPFPQLVISETASFTFRVLSLFASFSVLAPMSEVIQPNLPESSHAAVVTQSTFKRYFYGPFLICDVRTYRLEFLVYVFFKLSSDVIIHVLLAKGPKHSQAISMAVQPLQLICASNSTRISYTSQVANFRPITFLKLVASSLSKPAIPSIQAETKMLPFYHGIEFVSAPFKFINVAHIATQYKVAPVLKLVQLSPYSAVDEIDVVESAFDGTFENGTFEFTKSREVKTEPLASAAKKVMAQVKLLTTDDVAKAVPVEQAPAVELVKECETGTKTEEAQVELFTAENKMVVVADEQAPAVHLVDEYETRTETENNQIEVVTAEDKVVADEQAPAVELVEEYETKADEKENQVEFAVAEDEVVAVVDKQAPDVELVGDYETEAENEEAQVELVTAEDEVEAVADEQASAVELVVACETRTETMEAQVEFAAAEDDEEAVTDEQAPAVELVEESEAYSAPVESDVGVITTVLPEKSEVSEVYADLQARQDENQSGDFESTLTELVRETIAEVIAEEIKTARVYSGTLIKSGSLKLSDQVMRELETDSLKSHAPRIHPTLLLELATLPNLSNVTAPPRAPVPAYLDKNRFSNLSDTANTGRSEASALPSCRDDESAAPATPLYSQDRSNSLLLNAELNDLTFHANNSISRPKAPIPLTDLHKNRFSLPSEASSVPNSLPNTGRASFGHSDVGVTEFATVLSNTEQVIRASGLTNETPFLSPRDPALDICNLYEDQDKDKEEMTMIDSPTKSSSKKGVEEPFSYSHLIVKRISTFVRMDRRFFNSSSPNTSQKYTHLDSTKDDSSTRRYSLHVPISNLLLDINGIVAQDKCADQGDYVRVVIEIPHDKMSAEHIAKLLKIKQSSDGVKLILSESTSMTFNSGFSPPATPAVQTYDDRYSILMGVPTETIESNVSISSVDVEAMSVNHDSQDESALKFSSATAPSSPTISSVSSSPQKAKSSNTSINGQKKSSLFSKLMQFWEKPSSNKSFHE